jgi:hypothetical protein
VGNEQRSHIYKLLSIGHLVAISLSLSSDFILAKFASLSVKPMSSFHFGSFFPQILGIVNSGAASAIERIGEGLGAVSIVLCLISAQRPRRYVCRSRGVDFKYSNPTFDGMYSLR